MSRRVLMTTPARILACLLCAAAAGCPADRAPKATPRPDDTGMQVEDARRALFVLRAETDDADLRAALELVQVAPAETGPGDVVTFGPWVCRLREQTFVGSLAADPIFVEYVGTFSRDESGSWRARVDEVTRN